MHFRCDPWRTACTVALSTRRRQVSASSANWQLTATADLNDVQLQAGVVQECRFTVSQLSRFRAYPLRTSSASVCPSSFCPSAVVVHLDLVHRRSLTRWHSRRLALLHRDLRRLAPRTHATARRSLHRRSRRCTRVMKMREVQWRTIVSPRWCEMATRWTRELRRKEGRKTKRLRKVVGKRVSRRRQK